MKRTIITEAQLRKIIRGVIREEITKQYKTLHLNEGLVDEKLGFKGVLLAALMAVSTMMGAAKAEELPNGIKQEFKDQGLVQYAEGSGSSFTYTMYGDKEGKEIYIMVLQRVGSQQGGDFGQMRRAAQSYLEETYQKLLERIKRENLWGKMTEAEKTAFYKMKYGKTVDTGDSSFYRDPDGGGSFKMCIVQVQS